MIELTRGYVEHITVVELIAMLQQALDDKDLTGVERILVPSYKHGHESVENGSFVYGKKGDFVALKGK